MVLTTIMCVFCTKSLLCSRPRPQWVVGFKCIDVIQWSTFGWCGQVLLTSIYTVLRSNSAMLTSIRMKIWIKKEDRRRFTMVCERSTCNFHSWSYNPATIRWLTFGAYCYTTLVIKNGLPRLEALYTCIVFNNYCSLNKNERLWCRNSHCHEAIHAW